MISSIFWLFFFIHSWLISGSWSRSILLPWQNKRNPVWVLRPRPQSTTNHATSSFESNCFCQLNPICQHDFGSIFWQSPGGIQLFQELVKNHFIVPFRPFVCCWDQKAAQANVDLACAQQKKLRNFSCMCHRSGRCMPILAKPRSCPKKPRETETDTGCLRIKNKLKFLSWYFDISVDFLLVCVLL